MSPDDEDGDKAQSSFRLEISLAIGYQRKRARLASKLEADVTSIMLMLGGAVVVVLFVWLVARWTGVI